ncbi:arginase family protein [Paraburkholderia sp. BL25I1N1]|uniref:arginase family protein n=1 Tax=Paraburkholderia sp. BL25I1N1 TaxID=1938804 RepID=UPI000D074CBA|nr:arginase family protein [Paraburkholderia sp. BL25I1N1]PRX92063.1 arginase [Paraburkholderia sp. BL25I1N1]
MSLDKRADTLRLIMPQWQGGNNPPYYFGAELLAWLAPATDGPVETVPVKLPSDRPLPKEDGIVARTDLLEQLDAAFACIRKYNPDRIAVLGGDCLVDLAPFAYLNERYDGELAVLWIDAHPDILTPKEFEHAHAMVLGNLLGNGDADFVKTVRRPIKPQNVMYAGLKETLPVEGDFIEKNQLRFAGPAALAETSQPVIDWLKETGARHIAIHFDLDVLDASQFRSLLFANPADQPGAWDGIAQGSMTIPQIVRLINDVAAHSDVVGLGITEHLPWDALAMRNMLRQLPLLGR